MTAYYHNSVEVELILLTNALVVSSSLAEAKAEQPQLPTQSKKGIPFFLNSSSKVKTPLKKVNISFLCVLLSFDCCCFT